MALRVCPLCSAEFLETKTVCTHCNATLIDLDDDTDPRQLDPDDQVVYDLSAWPLDAVSDAAQTLAESGIPHVWDGTDVVMPLVHEAAGDRLLEGIEERYGLVGSDTSEDGERAAGDGTAGDDAPAASTGETEYDLTGWPQHQRIELVEHLVELGVPHRWEENLLIVPTTLEETVEELLDDLDEGSADEGDDEESELVDPAEVLSGLFLAAERMRRKRADVDTYGGLLTCLEVSDPAQPPYGLEGRVWTRALELGEQLADAVAEDSDDIEPLADELYQLLRPVV